MPRSRVRNIAIPKLPTQIAHEIATTEGRQSNYYNNLRKQKVKQKITISTLKKHKK